MNDSNTPSIDPRHLRPVNDLLDLLAEVTGVEVKPVTGNTRAPLTERFAAFHADNPHVYGALRTLAYQGLRDGRTRLSNAAKPERGNTEPGLTTAEEFERYCTENPVVYQVMVRLSGEWVRRFGTTKLGVRALLEKSRWEVRFATKDPHYKVNNNWAPWFGRLIMYREPGMAGLFDLRRAPEADAWITELATREGRLDELPHLMGWASDDSLGRAA